MNNGHHRWIKDNIDISDFYDRLPKAVKETISEAEEADKNDDEGTFICICEGLECQAKLFVPDVISTKRMGTVMRKVLGGINLKDRSDL